MTETIRVMHFIRSLDIGSQGGGAEVFAINLSRELKDQGVQITLAVMLRFWTSVEAEWAKKLEDEGFRVVFANDSPKPNLVKSLKIIQQECVSHKVDIGHGHYQVGNLLVCLLKLRKTVPVIIRTVHTPLEWGGGMIAWLARQTLTRWIFPLTMDMQICVNQTTAAQIQGYPGSRFGHKPVKVIPNALPIGMIERAREHAQHPKQVGKRLKFIIVSVGRITALKGYDNLLKAMPEILRALPQLELWIVGDGPDLLRLKQLAADLGISGQVKFTGQREDIPDILDQADLFVLPSLVEAFPTVILESMACGLPVIASDLPGIREMIRHDQTGWLVPPRDPTRLAEQILKALSSPDERQKIAVSAAKDVEKYSIKKIAAEYLAIYRQLLFEG